ncbi:MAG TPA: cation diffusion facilitator family transporter [Usitatibacter sp.]|jgi:cobalt-zinc-cadmium efflux system protein|nr:cation diffusion facilitator family transporter [Usitatibacter sp.]
MHAHHHDSRTHDPDHAHGHHAHGALENAGRAFAIGVALNLAFVVAEVVYGLAADSLALLADAGHNFGDVLGLLFAWGAATLAARAPTPRFTYGMRGSTILAALGNAMLLLVAIGGIAWEAIQRLSDPVPVHGVTVIWVAAAGIAVNAFTAWLFMHGRELDLNMRAAYLHMAGDALVSVGVVVAGVVMLTTGWLRVDPIVSLLVALVILYGTWGLLRESVRLALHAVPEQVDPGHVRLHLASLPGVCEVHDLHIWGMSTTETALTAHLVIPGGHPGDDFLREAAVQVEKRFNICHATFQIETASGEVPCALAPDHVV